MLHDAPLPPWSGKRLDEIASRLDGECEWFVTNGVLPVDMVTRNRRIAWWTLPDPRDSTVAMPTAAREVS
jgi:hypothetical protein